jgi:hypothetical protein
MRMNRFARTIPLSAALAITPIILPGCRDSHDPAPASSQSKFTAHLETEPSQEYTAVRLDVSSVKVAALGDPAVALTDKDWHVVGHPKRRLELRPAEGTQSPQMLAGPVQLPNKAYNRVCLVLGPGPHQVRLANGTEAELQVPEPLRKGILLELETGSKAQQEYEIHLVLDPSRAIQKSSDSSGKIHYSLRPRLRAVDRKSTVAITGHLRDEAGNALGGQLLSAQIQQPATDGGDRVRCVRTASDGSFNLDLLAWPATYWVVAPAVTGPEGAPSGFEAQASSPIRFTQPANQACPLVLRHASAGPAGTVTGTIKQRLSPTSHDEVEVLQELPAGSRARHVVHGVVALPASDFATSSYTLSMPPGQFAVRHTRITVDAAGMPTRSTSIAKPTVVNSGSVTTVDF